MRRCTFPARRDSGFTLIELVLVIVILGVLSAVALPKFIDLSGDARMARAQSYASAITSATSLNYMAKMSGKASYAPLSGNPLLMLNEIRPLLLGADLGPDDSPASASFLLPGNFAFISTDNNCFIRPSDGLTSSFYIVDLDMAAKRAPKNIQEEMEIANLSPKGVISCAN